MKIEWVFPKWNIYTEDQLHVPKEKCEPVVRVSELREWLQQAANIDAFADSHQAKMMIRHAKQLLHTLTEGLG